MRIETARLRLEQIDEATADPAELLEVFNSVPDFIEASEQFTGKRAYTLNEVEMNVWQEIARENGRLLAIRSRETADLVGIASLAVPHPERPHPWLGLLLINRTRQGQGLGAEALEAIETALREEAWSELQLGVLTACADVRTWYERRGYVVVTERSDQDKRAVWILRKELDEEQPRGTRAVASRP